jgi:hypothetical protein
MWRLRGARQQTTTWRRSGRCESNSAVLLPAGCCCCVPGWTVHCVGTSHPCTHVIHTTLIGRCIPSVPIPFLGYAPRSSARVATSHPRRRKALPQFQRLRCCPSCICFGLSPSTFLYCACYTAIDGQPGRTARHGTGTSTTRHDTTRHDTARHGKGSVPCLLVSPCWTLGPGTTLSASIRVVPCHQARRHASASASTGTMHKMPATAIKQSNRITDNFIMTSSNQTDTR